MIKGDTTRTAQQVWITAVRQLNPTERLRETLSFSESIRSLALSRLRALHPERTDAALMEMLRDAATGPSHRAHDGS